MKTKEQIVTFIQKQRVAFIASVDEDGFPNMKAMFVPRKIEAIAFIFQLIPLPCVPGNSWKIPKQVFIFLTKAAFGTKALC